MNKNLLKHILIPGIGFGIGGMIWGISIYQSDLGISIFGYLSESLILGILGGIFIALNTKKTLRVILLGSIGFLISFIIGAILTYPIGILSIGIIKMIFWRITSPEGWDSILMIQSFFLVFALIGSIIGAFYAFALKIKVLSLAKYGAIGFALGSLIGPIIGNGILNLSGSLFLTYLITFFIICAFLGAFLGLGIYRNAEMTKEKS
jgi:hypothetical protein